MAKKTEKPVSAKKAPTTPEKKKRNAVCGTCNKPGHNARTCGR